MAVDPITVIKVAGKVKDVSETVNTATKAMGINQESIFAKNEEEGKGGAINSVLQTADTVTGGVIGKTVEKADEATGGLASKGIQSADKIVTPILDVADAADGPDIDDVAKMGKKLPPNLQA